jgi:(p)ppGpp synthase/HD superfamily hydrolase
MNSWDQEKYIKAWNFASKIHNGQFMPGSDIPYINHIGLVAMEVMSAIAVSDNTNNPDLLVQCALLHDSIEDTDTCYEDIKNNFKKEVADGVLALSKNFDLPSKLEQMEDSLQRIKKQPKEIGMVKLADRITNLQKPPKHWDKEKINQYREEASLIHKNLANSNRFLADRLMNKISDYQVY